MRAMLSKLVTSHLLGVISSLYAAWVFHLFWAWFAVPIGAPPIEVIHAFGWALMAGLLLGARGIELNNPQPPIFLFMLSIYMTTILWITGAAAVWWVS